MNIDFSKIINVTQEDIDNGLRTSSCKCPIARAAKREFGLPALISPSFSLFLLKDYENILFSLPSSARDFINDFDGERPVKPFSFQISQRF